MPAAPLPPPVHPPREGAGETIRWDCRETPAGTLLLAATARGLCAASLGSTPDALETALRAAFPSAEIVHDPGALAAYAAPFGAYLRGEIPGLDGLALDLRGTGFQQRVWALLRQIPPGQTRTYGELAAALGQPGAVRAVARACGANAIALAVPCHRVVGAGGALRGYRWGTARKRWLLEHEHAPAPTLFSPPAPRR